MLARPTYFSRQAARAFTVLALGIGGLSEAEAQYTFTDITVPNSTESWAHSITDADLVTGATSEPAYPSYHPYLWFDGEFHVLPLPGYAGAPTLSADGLITGDYSDANNAVHFYSFLFKDGTLTPLGPNGSVEARVNLRLPNGVFAGTYEVAADNRKDTHAFVRVGAQFTDLTPTARFVSDLDVTPGGYLLGTFHDGVTFNTCGFTWHNGQLRDLVPEGGTLIRILNSNPEIDGQAVGEYMASDGKPHAFYWREGVFHDLHPAGAQSSRVERANASGRVIGGFVTADDTPHAFTWQDGTFTDLNAAIPANVRTVVLIGLDTSGQVLGSFTELGADPWKSFVWKDGELTILAPGKARSSVADFNAIGAIQGRYIDAEGVGHTFIWKDGVYQSFAPAGVVNISTGTITADGRYIGTFDATDGSVRAYTWKDGVFTDLGFAGALDLRLGATLKPGGIIGAFRDADFRDHAFIWEDGVLTEITVPGAVSVVITVETAAGRLGGTYTDASGHAHPFLWFSGEATDLSRPDEDGGRVVAVNAAGQVLGISESALHENHHRPSAFVWQNGVFTEISAPGSNSIHLQSLTDNGEVTGQIYGGPHSGKFLWIDGHYVATRSGSTSVEVYPSSANASGHTLGVFDGSGVSPEAFVRRDGLFVALGSFFPPGTKWTRPGAINAAGKIVGSYADANSVVRAFLLSPDGVTPTPTPVPSPKPSPSASPTPPPAAVVQLTSKPPRVTRAKAVTIKGTTTGRVRYRVNGHGWKLGPAKARWRVSPALERGRNVITLLATGAGGNSKPIRFVVIRR